MGDRNREAEVDTVVVEGAALLRLHLAEESTDVTARGKQRRRLVMNPLHVSVLVEGVVKPPRLLADLAGADLHHRPGKDRRSEEHTSELQSLAYLVCRLLLEKKKNNINTTLSCEVRSVSHVL